MTAGADMALGSTLLHRDLMVAAYVLAMLAAGRGWRRAGRGAFAWASCLAILGLLAVDQHVGLFDALVDIARDQAERGGWWTRRRPLQGASVVAIAIASAAIAAVLLGHFRREPWQVRATLAAAIGLLALALAKAVSLHALDNVLGRGLLPGLPLGAVLELAGLAVVLCAGLAVPRAATPASSS